MRERRPGTWQHRGQFRRIKKVYDYAEGKLTTVDVNIILLLGTDSEGKTAWHLAAEWGNLDSLKKGMGVCSRETNKRGDK